MLELQPTPWMPVAWGELAAKLHELPGDKDDPRILAYLTAPYLVAKPVDARGQVHDEIAWCAAGACHCLEAAGVVSPRRVNARSFLAWGVPLEAVRVGAIAVFSRGTNPLQGHVGFVAGWTRAGDILLLAGNQGNAWSVALQPRERLLGLRLPAAA